MKLYEINEALERCIIVNDDTAVDTETGEVIDIEAVKALAMERDTKLENIGCWIKNLESDAAQIKEERDNLYKREKAAKNKAGQLREYLSTVLEGKPFKTAKVAMSFRKSEMVDFTGDLSKVPTEYLRVKEPELNKTAIKKALKDGTKLDGFMLVERQNLQIK